MVISISLHFLKKVKIMSETKKTEQSNKEIKALFIFYLLLMLNGALMQTRNSGNTCVFMCVLHTIYLLGEAKSSTPESNSGELGHD